MIILPGNDSSHVIKSPARIRLERGIDKFFNHVVNCFLSTILDFENLVLPENIQIVKLDYEGMLVHVRLFPDEGPFSGGKIDFELKIPPMYPHSPPKARIHQKVKVFEL